jgi:hypothetical protein
MNSCGSATSPIALHRHRTEIELLLRRLELRELEPRREP